MNIDIDNIAAHNARVLSQSLRAITPTNIGTIVTCAARGLGERRMSGAIAAVASEFGADVPVVLAAFGFVQVNDDGVEHFADALACNCGVIDVSDNSEVRAAWRLAQLAFGFYPRSQVSMRGERSRRIAGVIKRNSPFRRRSLSDRG